MGGTASDSQVRGNGYITHRVSCSNLPTFEVAEEGNRRILALDEILTSLLHHAAALGCKAVPVLIIIPRSAWGEPWSAFTPETLGIS